jgi:NADH-quinone oxidoreductase subunit I
MFGSGIAKGMWTTLKHFAGKKYTVQYPEERAPLHTGFRGLPRLLYDDTPENLRCVACSICANACPVHVIHIETHRGEDRKLVLDRFDLEAGGCVFCGLCVEACPFEALTMMHGFEMAAYNREQLLWTKEMLPIKASARTLADMDRIHGPNEKEEKKAAPAAPKTAPAAATAEATAAPASAPTPKNPDEAAATNGKAIGTTEPAKTMAAAVPGNTGGERDAAVADAELAPPRVKVEESPEKATKDPVG